MSSILRLQGRGKSKIFWGMFPVFLAFLIVDIVINNVALNTNAENISSAPWIALFVALTAVFGAGQYVFLGFLKTNSRIIGIRNAKLHKSYYIVMIIQYLLFGILLATSLEVVLTSSYTTSFLAVSNTLSLGLATAILAILSWLFFLWCKTNKNFVVLLYGLSSVAIIVNMILTVVFYDLGLSQLPSIRTAKSEVKFPFFDPNSSIGIIQNLQALTAVVYFILLWASTALLLQHYSRRVGKVKFWGIIIIPLASFIIQWLVVIPYWVLHPQQNITYIVLGQTLPGLASGVLFAVPFWTISRALHPASVSNYMIISGIGIILFQFSTTAGILHGPYPPFGLYSISLTGLSSFFMLIGFYSSAISTAQDLGIRERIRRAVIEEVEMLGSIASAEMVQELARKVTKVAKDNLDLFYQETGVLTPITDKEIKGYLDAVITETKKAKLNEPANGEDQRKAKDEFVKRRDSEVE